MRAAVKGLDFLLRRCYGIHEFSRHPDCVARLALARSPRELTLSDGTRIARGEIVGDLHLWNERVPPMPSGGPDLAWGLGFQRKLSRSLAELAAYVEVDPRYKGVRAFRAVGSFMAGGALAALARRLGFEVVRDERPPSPWRRFAEFWENAFNLALVWAYNAPSLRTRHLPGLKRVQLWIPRRTLIDKYGTGPRG